MCSFANFSARPASCFFNASTICLCSWFDCTERFGSASVIFARVVHNDENQAAHVLILCCRKHCIKFHGNGCQVPQPVPNFLLQHENPTDIYFHPVHLTVLWWSYPLPTLHTVPPDATVSRRYPEYLFGNTYDISTFIRDNGNQSLKFKLAECLTHRSTADT